MNSKEKNIKVEKERIYYNEVIYKEAKKEIKNTLGKEVKVNRMSQETVKQLTEEGYKIYETQNGYLIDWSEEDEKESREGWFELSKIRKADLFFKKYIIFCVFTVLIAWLIL